MINKNSAPENVSDFVLKSVLLESDRSAMRIDIARVTTDLEIYEHLNKPYLTGKLLFVDSFGLYSQIGIDGGERIQIKIISTRKDSIEIVKRFVISKVNSVTKTNDNTEVISLQLVEDFAFYSHALNVNKAYTETPSNIIQKIAQGFLNKNVLSSNDNFQELVKVIIPNLNPLQAMVWIKNIATNKSGFPYYVFSTLGNSYINFFDLETLITAEPMNPNSPYKYWQSNSQANNGTSRRRTINAFAYTDIEDVFSLIGNGVIGAQYTYLNTLTGSNQTFTFNVVDDVLKNLYDNVLNKNQRIPLYSPDLKYEDDFVHELKSRKITQIGGAGVFQTAGSRVNSYNEASTVGDYKKKIISKSLESFLSKSPINIAVNGLDFIDGNGNSSIGNNIRIQFLSSQIDAKTKNNVIDNKKSGDYLIYSARHIFKNERYDVLLGCAKLANSASK